MSEHIADQIKAYGDWLERGGTAVDRSWREAHGHVFRILESMRIEIAQNASAAHPELERCACYDCRETLENRDFTLLMATDEHEHVIGQYRCTECCTKTLKLMTFEDAVKDHLVLTWCGRTWSFVLPLYKEEAWNTMSKGLEQGDLFPEQKRDA